MTLGIIFIIIGAGLLVWGLWQLSDPNRKSEGSVDWADLVGDLFDD